jgi:3D (Asp-Asp-Asp) domain-containing protein
MNKNDVKVGDVIQFIYDGGTHRGSIRTLEVKRVTVDYADGHDKFVNSHRRFHFSKMRNLQLAKASSEAKSIKVFCRGSKLIIQGQNNIAFFINGDTLVDINGNAISPKDFLYRLKDLK